MSAARAMVSPGRRAPCSWKPLAARVIPRRLPDEPLRRAAARITGVAKPGAVLLMFAFAPRPPRPGTAGPRPCPDLCTLPGLGSHVQPSRQRDHAEQGDA